MAFQPPETFIHLRNTFLFSIDSKVPDSFIVYKGTKNILQTDHMPSVFQSKYYKLWEYFCLQIKHK